MFKMKNLAGETMADLNILDELSEAGIKIISGEKSEGEVPYTLTGKLTDWNFSRAWYYWMAHADEGKGLPLDIATELHEKEYLIKGEEWHINKYGNVIRVEGDCGCPPPEMWATNTTKGKVIKSYHIDSQEGLNTFAETIRNLHGMTSSGTNPKEIKSLYDKISKGYSEWEAIEELEGVEWLKKRPTLEYEGKKITELCVAIKKESEVVSIAKKWEKDMDKKGIVQYFFEGGKISGFNCGLCRGTGQILNRGPEIDEPLRQHYEEIKGIRPRAASSLERCMQELEKPGPEYTC